MKKIISLLLVGASLQFFSCKKSEEIDPAVQLQKDIEEIDAYLALLGQNAVKDPSGVRYVINVLGTGLKPTTTSEVGVKYSVSLLNGTPLFTQEKGEVLALAGLIPGWQIALPQIPKGSKFDLYIPSGLAYGPGGTSLIPPNAILLYEIELLDDDAVLAADIAYIDNYLDSIAAEDVIEDPTGIRYIVVGELGTGATATSTSIVTVTYTGKFLKTGAVFTTQSTAQSVDISKVIKGWRIALLQIPAGTHFTLYVPSGLAYGPGGSNDGVVTPDAVLVFDVNLIAVN